MYYVVPVIEGALDIDYRDLQDGIQTSATECYVRLCDGVTERPTWQEVSEQEFDAIKEQMGLVEPPA